MNVKSFFGVLLMIVGGLVALAAGGCTVIFAGSELWRLLERGRFGRAGEMLFTAALVGGIPFLIGLGLFRLGRSISRPPQPAWGREVPTPSIWRRIGEELGYAFREMRDEFALLFGLGKKRPPDDRDDAPKG